LIYLDNQATTRLLPAVLDEMLPWLQGEYGNPSSVHGMGRKAREAVEHARERVAKLINARPYEIIFTSGGTEANNLAIRGLLQPGHEALVSAVEHASVFEAWDNKKVVKPDPLGRIHAGQVSELLGLKTRLVAVMAANNEVGTINDVTHIGGELPGDVFFHIDAVQMVGHMPFDVRATHASTASLSAHKIHGPKGVGALFVNHKAARKLRPLVGGGGHERGKRSGTLNVAGIVGFGAACKNILEVQEVVADHVRNVRDELWSRLRALLGDRVQLVGPATHGTGRLPHNLTVQFLGCEARALVTTLADEVACSTGSACSSLSFEPSRVLTAMGMTDKEAMEVVRLSVSTFTTPGEVEEACQKVAAVVESL